MLYSLCLSHSKGQGNYDTVKVYFPLNITALNATAMRTLDNLIQIVQDRKLLIYGYADYLGNELANIQLAEKRAEHVKQYLCSKNINAHQILVCAGIGEVYQATQNQTPEGNPKDRYVAVFIKKTSQSIRAQKNSLAPDTIIHKRQILNNKKQPSTATESRFELLAELKPNEVMRVESIQFQATRHFITKESEPIVQELLSTLKENPELVIRIEGHVCCMKGDGDALDTDTNEMKLSENRAKFIYQYLIENGIDKNRLSYIGYGKKKPIIAIEHSEEDAQRNRRVELRVIRN
jgi:outer membrane protein OmpA-like peptidoglycan-associated protein